MKVLTIGDPHFKENNKEDTDLLLENTIKLIKEDKVDIVIVLGDIMHYHGRGDVKIYMRCCDYLRAIASLVGKENSFLIIGNHDRINNSISEGPEHWFYSIKENKDYPTIVDSKTYVKRESFSFCLLPYISPGKLFSYVSEESIASYDAFFGHQEIKGCNIGGRKSLVGDEWKEEYPPFISGHIHKGHQINNNILYVGTPYQVDFGDSGEKHVHIFDFSKNIEKNKIPPHNKYNLQIPQKLTLTMSTSEFDKYSFNDKDWIRIKIIDGPKKIQLLKKSRKYQEILEKPKIKIVFRDLTVESSEITNKEVEEKTTTKLPFIDRLYKKIENDKNLKEIFDNVFN